jgi:hypothetical protein
LATERLSADQGAICARMAKGDNSRWQITNKEGNIRGRVHGGAK